MKTPYFKKLLDPRWQKKRLETMEFADWHCEVCGDGTTTLHVHHKQYIKDREPWEYECSQLSVLCKDCHSDQHSAEDGLIDVVSRLPIEGMKWIDRKKAACLLAGVMGLEDFSPKDSCEKAWFYAGLRVQDCADEFVKKFQSEAEGEAS